MTDEHLREILNNAWTLLETGAASRHSAAHHPVVATLNADGQPDQRVMILREANRATATLRFHTDARSPKVAQMAAKTRDGAPVHILVYDPEAKTQLRLSGTIRAETDTPAANAAWNASTTFARRCYMAETAPGAVSDVPTSGLPAWIEGQQPSEADVTPARTNFAILLAEIDRIDWLYLANSGHRRAVLDRTETCWSGRWSVP